MSASQSTIALCIILALLPCCCHGQIDIERTLEILGDFLKLLTDEDVRRVVNEFLDNRSGRRLQQLDFGDIDVEDLFEGLVDDLDIAVNLSEFVDGLMSTPLLDFAARLPQSEEEAEALVKAQYNEYCSSEVKVDGGKVGDSCRSWIVKFELLPGTCEIVNRNQQEYKCDPPMLVYTREPPECLSRHIKPAEYSSKECKITKAKGIGKEMVVGGGQFDVRLKLGLQDVDIISNLDLSDLASLFDLGGLF